jgi:hypothetical protein
VVIPYYIESAVCLGSAMLGMKAAAEEELNLWGNLKVGRKCDCRCDDKLEQRWNCGLSD